MGHLIAPYRSAPGIWRPDACSWLIYARTEILVQAGDARTQDRIFRNIFAGTQRQSPLSSSPSRYTFSGGSELMGSLRTILVAAYLALFGWYGSVVPPPTLNHVTRTQAFGDVDSHDDIASAWVRDNRILRSKHVITLWPSGSDRDSVDVALEVRRSIRIEVLAARGPSDAWRIDCLTMASAVTCRLHHFKAQSRPVFQIAVVTDSDEPPAVSSLTSGVLDREWRQSEAGTEFFRSSLPPEDIVGVFLTLSICFGALAAIFCASTRLKRRFPAVSRFDDRLREGVLDIGRHFYSRFSELHRSWRCQFS
jgi:hypothetical protein